MLFSTPERLDIQQLQIAGKGASWAQSMMPWLTAGKDMLRGQLLPHWFCFGQPVPDVIGLVDPGAMLSHISGNLRITPPDKSCIRAIT